jgi:sulfonate transport system substrate-binding protein
MTTPHATTPHRSIHGLRRCAAMVAMLALVVAACGDAEGSEGADTLTLDWATYNPLSLIIRDQGWLEEALADDGIEVEWLQSAGSNRANEGLRSGALDIGSTAGSAALLARANGSPIKAISLYSQPEWAAIVVPEDSPITRVEDLAGTSIAATLGTDPYFFLLQALEQAGVSLDDVEIQNLQHADGRSALEQGSVDAWAGLDPIMAASEAESGTELIFRDIDFNTWGFLNATESFLEREPELAQLVVDAYERARQWAADNPDETAELLAEVAGIDLEVARITLLERTNLDIDPVPGETQRDVLEVVGPIFVATGDVDDQGAIDEALASLFETSFGESADAARVDS